MGANFFALGAILLWSSLAALSLSLSETPPFFLVGVCLTAGSLCGLPWYRQWSFRPKLLLLGIFGLFGYHFCLFMAFRLASPVEANLLNYLWPLLIVVLTPLFVSGAKLYARHYISIAMGFTGALLIVTRGQLSFSSQDLPGYALALSAAVIWAIYSLLSNRQKEIPTASIAGFCFVSGLLSLACHFAFESSYFPKASDLPIFVFLALGPMGAAFFFWDKAMKTGDPRRIGALSYLTPMLSTLFLIFSARGEFTFVTATAMILIIGGAAVSTWKDPGATLPPSESQTRTARVP